MDNYLQDLRAEGDSDSEGSFTMDLGRSAFKMAQFRLANPGDYPIHVLACAVAGGAKEFHLSTTDMMGLCTLRFDGKPFTDKDFRMLARSMGQGKLPRRLKELEVALSAAAAFGQVRFAVRGAKFSKELRFVGGEGQIVDLPPSHEEMNTLAVTSMQTAVNIDGFRKRCRYAPLKMFIDGERFGHTIDFGQMRNSCPGVWQIKGREKLKVRKQKEHSSVFLRSINNKQGSSLVLCLNPMVATSRGTLVLSDGVVMDEVKDYFDFPAVVGAFTVSHLNKDLSRQGLLQDELYNQHNDWLQRELEFFIRGFCSAPPPGLQALERRVLCLQFELRYQNRETPPEVAEFLASVTDIKASKDREELDSIAQTALSTGHSTFFDRMNESLYVEFERAWVKRDWENASDWCEARLYLMKAVQQEDLQTQALLSFTKVLQFQGDSFAPLGQLWEQDVESQELFRLLLVAFGGKEGKSYINQLLELSPSEDWRGVFSLLGPVELGALSRRWTLAHLFIHGAPQEFLRALGECLQEPEELKLLPYWLLAFRRSRRGQLTWVDQVKLTVRQSFAWWANPVATKVDRFHNCLRKIEESEFDIGGPGAEWLDSISPACADPLLCFRLYHLSERPAEQRLLLSRFLLAASFDPYEARIELSSPIPWKLSI